MEEFADIPLYDVVARPRGVEQCMLNNRGKPEHNHGT